MTIYYIDFLTGSDSNNGTSTEIFKTGTTIPIVGARVDVSTDAAGNNRIRSELTNSLGKARFTLDAGTYYLWIYDEQYKEKGPIEVTVQ